MPLPLIGDLVAGPSIGRRVHRRRHCPGELGIVDGALSAAPGADWGIAVGTTPPSRGGGPRWWDERPAATGRLIGTCSRGYDLGVEWDLVSDLCGEYWWDVQKLVRI